MSRVEKELASLAPWAWDPLVGKHAPGSAMMRDFTEVVADKTVTGNTDSYRFNPDGPHPHSADGTPAHAHVGGKRARSPPSSSSAPRASTAQRDAAPSSPARRRRATPTTALAASKQHTATKPRSVLGVARAAANGPASAKVSAGKTLRRDASAARCVGKNLVDALDAATRDDDDEEAADAKARAEAAKAAAKAIRREKDAAAKREKRRAVAAAANVGRDAAGDVPEKENASPANGVRTDARSVPSGSFSVPVPAPASTPAVPRELTALDPPAPAESRRRREAALLAVAEAEEAAANTPRVTPSQHLLATYYKLTGRTPPAGSVANTSSAAPDRERTTKAKAKASSAKATTSSSPPTCSVVVSPFHGREMRRPEDFARYDAQPLRVVPFTAELARACVYLDRRDARDAAAEAKAAT